MTHIGPWRERCDGCGTRHLEYRINVRKATKRFLLVRMTDWSNVVAAHTLLGKDGVDLQAVQRSARFVMARRMQEPGAVRAAVAGVRKDPVGGTAGEPNET